MKITTIPKRLCEDTISGYQIQLVTTISSFNIDVIEDMWQKFTEQYGSGQILEVDENGGQE